MNKRLSDYLFKRQLPANISEYSQMGTYEGICPFCNTATDYEFLHVDPDSYHSFYICGDCEDDMVDFKDGIEEIQKQLEKNHVNLESPSHIKMYANKIKKRTKSRIKYFNEMGTIPPNMVVPSKLKLPRCFFCETRFGTTGTNSHIFNVDVPVGFDCNGGFINACEECHSKLNTAKSREYAENCKLCNKGYFIQKDEFDARVNEKYREKKKYKLATFANTNKYICPTCYDATHGLHNSRWVNLICKSCGADYIADRFQYVEAHLVPDPGDWTCENCFIEQRAPTNITIIYPEAGRNEKNFSCFIKIEEDKIKPEREHPQFRVSLWSCKNIGSYVGAKEVEFSEFEHPNVFEATLAGLDMYAGLASQLRFHV